MKKYFETMRILQTFEQDISIITTVSAALSSQTTHVKQNEVHMCAVSITSNATTEQHFPQYQWGKSASKDLENETSNSRGNMQAVNTN